MAELCYFETDKTLTRCAQVSPSFSNERRQEQPRLVGPTSTPFRSVHCVLYQRIVEEQIQLAKGWLTTGGPQCAHSRYQVGLRTSRSPGIVMGQR